MTSPRAYNYHLSLYVKHNQQDAHSRAIVDPFGVDPLCGELVMGYISKKGLAILIWQIINLAGLLLPNF